MLCRSTIAWKLVVLNFICPGIECRKYYAGVERQGYVCTKSWIVDCSGLKLLDESFKLLEKWPRGCPGRVRRGKH